MTAEPHASLTFAGVTARYKHVSSQSVSTVTVLLLLIYMYVITSPMNVISVPAIVCVLHISWRRDVGPDRAGQTAGTWQL